MKNSTRSTLGLVAFLAMGTLTLSAITVTAQDEPPADEPAEVQEAEGLIEVSEEGAELDPPATSDQIPVGAWHCDMGGSVHYAALTEGDGACPICGMFLTQKAEAEPPPTGHEGHGH